MAEFRKHLVARAFQRFTADNRANCDDTFAARAQRFANPCDRKNRPDADERIARANHDAIGIADRFEHAWRRFCALDAVEPNAFHDRFRATFHQIFLKMQRAFV